MRRIARGLRKYVLESASPFLVPLTHQGGDRTYPLSEPFRTVTCANRGETALVAPYLTKFNQNSLGQELQSPLDTVMAGAPRFAMVAPYLVPRHGERPGQEPRCSSAEAPMPVITPGNEQGSLVAAWMAQHNTGSIGRSVEEPVPTLTASGTHVAEVRAFLQAYYGTDQDARLDAPLPTITTRDRFGIVVCYQLVDIGMRMLSPRELFRAQGFPAGYIIDPIYEGAPLIKTAQIRCCGNSVCPDVARALVAANYTDHSVTPRPLRRRIREPRGQGALL
jgi:DNA (cytosine-5)-methyltransferase 1